jgi:hypothetical protein
MSSSDSGAGSDHDQDLGPFTDSDFAVRHGLVGASPDVVVDGPLVRRAREAARLTPTDVALAMSRRGFDQDATAVSSLEDAPAHRMRPREARLLAAILDLPLAAIEAQPVPWPAESADVASLGAAGVETVVLGTGVALRTSNGGYLGLLRCGGSASDLDSRTYRLAAATLLNGAWSHLAGALLVTAAPPHMALAVDALDCVTRAHAPTGLSGFSRLASPEPLADAVASYETTYSIGWADPEPLDDLLAASSGVDDGGAVASGLGEAVRALREQARRARQAGKRPGYEAAARWLAAVDADDVVALLDEVAGATPAAARERLGEVLSP